MCNNRVNRLRWNVTLNLLWQLFGALWDDGSHSIVV